MPGLAWIALVLAVWQGQGAKDDAPAYVREGDRVEQEFRSYREKLDQFSQSLRSIVTQDRPAFLTQLQDAPPSPVLSGHQVLPRLVELMPADASKPVTSFSYSWPITESYVSAEKVKLDYAEDDLRHVKTATDSVPASMIAKLVRDYRELATNQRTIDQYIQYNRFWQSSIAVDRPRFDQLTRIYDLMKAGEPDTSRAIRDVLGTPQVPVFVRVTTEPARTVIHVPVYTDIDDEGFLTKAKTAIETMWQAPDGDKSFAVEIEFRITPLARIYPEDSIPQRGARLDMRTHTARFPADGAVLTTGAQSIHSLVGRYVALGTGDVSIQTLAHEFGHVLGFRDGYVRGYRDLGDKGFEILELTSFFDDIMSAPRQGRVQAEHFRLILDALRKR